jgi:hypothetical protein
MHGNSYDKKVFNSNKITSLTKKPIKSNINQIRNPWAVKIGNNDINSFDYNVFFNDLR